MASRKEQKEALRREREERERQTHEQRRRKRLVGYGIGAALALAAVVVVVVVLVSGGGGDGGDAGAQVLPKGGKAPAAKVTGLKQAAGDAGCRLTSEKAKSRNHVRDPNRKVKYRTNPPSDGQHYAIPTEDGAYSKAPPDSHLVHTLEHGRVIVWFKPSLPRPARANLKALFDEDPYQMVLVPRAKMPFDVAASAWGRDPQPLGTGFLMGCPRYGDEVFDAIRTFRDEHRSNGPEPVP